MRNGLIGFMGALALPSAIAIVGCADYSSSSGNTGGTGSSAGGSSSTGGSSSGTTGGSSSSTGGSSNNGTGGSSSTTCTSVTACGGDVVATWNATSSCLKVSGQIDVSSFGLGCTSADVTGSLTVTGSITMGSDGTITDNTTTTGDEQITLAAACLFVSGTTTTCDRVGAPLTIYSSVNCQNATGGGCTCTGHVNQEGGMGYVTVTPVTSGNYTTASNVLSTTAGRDEMKYDYCVSGSNLNVTPQSSAMSIGTLTGTVTFQKQ